MSRKLMLADFQPEHAEAIFAMNGGLFSVPFNELILAYTSSGSQARTIMRGSDPVACGGIINIGWRRGEAWFLVSPLMRQYRKTVVSWLRKYLPDLALAGGFRRVQATCFDLENGHLFRFLGFEREGLLRSFGPAGQDAIMFGRIFGGGQ
jgi:hypothetical protein